MSVNLAPETVLYNTNQRRCQWSAE